MLLQNLTHAGGNNMSPMSLNILSRVGPLHVTAIGEFWNYTKYKINIFYPDINQLLTIQEHMDSRT